MNDEQLLKYLVPENLKNQPFACLPKASSTEHRDRNQQSARSSSVK